MEKAIFISSDRDLKFIREGFSRIYYGNEFCQNRIPSLDSLAGACDIAVEKRMKFTFVTPFVTDKGISQLRALFSFLTKNMEGLEIVANDWGVIEVLKGEFSFNNIALGRLLVKQRRCPRIISLKKKMPGGSCSIFKCAQADSLIFSKYLLEEKISRIEIDNLLQGIVRQAPVIPASLYTPFAYISTTRFCPSSCLPGHKRRIQDGQGCGSACRDYFLRLRNKLIPGEILLKGNTYFVKNDKLP
ncbi:MAG: hypothetical protein FJZ15_07110, partial [Candidatus Omnitrophica bacterium]|nr:hypothetical protein [Candidatus Omnitrophota bacterium]